MSRFLYRYPQIKTVYHHSEIIWCWLRFCFHFCFFFRHLLYRVFVFILSDLEMQGITLQHHKPCTVLICRTGFHHLLICIHCKSVCTSVVLHGTSWGVCSVSHSTLQLFPPTLPLLVNRHISIFISRLPQLWAVKCLQAFFF